MYFFFLIYLALSFILLVTYFYYNKMVLLIRVNYLGFIKTYLKTLFGILSPKLKILFGILKRPWHMIPQPILIDFPGTNALKLRASRCAAHYQSTLNTTQKRTIWISTIYFAVGRGLVLLLYGYGHDIFIAVVASSYKVHRKLICFRWQ